MRKLSPVFWGAAISVGLCFLISGAQVSASDIAIDSSNFPDAEFRRYISENIDTDQNGVLSSEEIKNCDEIDIGIISVNEPHYEVADLTGIQYFTEITNLDCYNCGLGKIDVSNNTKLLFLDVSGNKLTSLDVSKLTTLYNLYASENQLTEIDLSNNAALMSLRLDKNQLTKIDLSNNIELNLVNLSSNQITELEISRNFRIENLNISDNQIKTLDLSSNVRLAYFSACNNGMESINLGKCPLVMLRFYGNKINELDLSSFSRLVEIITEAPRAGVRKVDFSEQEYYYWEMEQYNSVDVVFVDTYTKVIIDGKEANSLSSKRGSFFHRF